MPTDEELKEASRALFFSRLKGSRVAAELFTILKDYQAIAKDAFTGYNGDNPQELMMLRYQWKARVDLSWEIESAIENGADRAEEIAGEIGMNLEELRLRSEIL